MYKRQEFYTPEELTRIVTRSAGLLNVPIDPAGALELARRSRGTPRIANRLLRRVRDYAQVKGDGHIDLGLADRALKMLDVDPQGFDVMDRKLLEAVIHRFAGGPVGLDNVAAAIGEEAGTIEDVIEPYLIQQGYLQRTPRGRVAKMCIRDSIMGQQVVRLSSGHVQQAHEPVNLTLLLRDALLQRGREIESHGIEVQQVLAPAEVLSDETLLYSLLETVLDWSFEHALSRIDFRLDMTNWPVHARLAVSFLHQPPDMVEETAPPSTCLLYTSRCV